MDALRSFSDSSGKFLIKVLDFTSEESGWLVTAALVVATSFLVWGKIAALVTSSSLLFLYTSFGPVVKVLNFFDLRGITMAGAAIALPYLGGGMLATVVGTYLAVSLVGLLWQQARHLSSLESQREHLEENNKALQKTTAEILKITGEIQSIKESSEAIQEKLRKLQDLQGRLDSLFQSNGALSQETAQNLMGALTSISTVAKAMEEEAQKINLGNVVSTLEQSSSELFAAIRAKASLQVPHESRQLEASA